MNKQTKGKNTGKNSSANTYPRKETQNQKKLNESTKQNDGKSKKKVGINARNEKGKYSDDEIARAKYAESKAKFLVRDRINNENIDTRGKWIDIQNLKKIDKWDKKGNYIPEILSFDTELFDKKEIPVYDENMSEDEKHQLTYDVAQKDIEKQRAAERKSHKKEDRPTFHIEVSAKQTKGNKTEYQINNIKEKK